MPTTLVPNNEAILLRLNREDQIAALEELFPNDENVNSEMTLADIAKYIRWAGGTLDVRLATYNATDNKLYFFTETEWNNTLGQQGYTKMGIALRARRQFLIISPEATSAAIKYGGYGLTFADVEQRGATNAFNFDFEYGRYNTSQIVAQTQGYTSQGITGAPAAEYCWNWHNEDDYTGADKGKLQWYLPSVAELSLIAENAVAINSAIGIFFPTSGMTLGSRYIWTCNPAFAATHAYAIEESTGRATITYRGTNDLSARAVSSPAFFLG